MRKLLYFLLFLSFASFGQEIGIISSSVQTSFSPASLTPAAWWDSNAANMSSTGDFWNDTQGNYNLAATGTARPTYNATALNSRPGFVFDGSVNQIGGSTVITQIQNVQNVTVWMVTKRCVFGHFTGSTTFEVTHFTDDHIYAAPVNYTNYGHVSSTNVFHYILVLFDGTQSTNATKLKIYVNGVNQTLTFVGTIPTTTSSASAIPDIGLGAVGAVAGTVCEVGVIGRTITGTEITNLNSYLATKYGL